MRNKFTVNPVLYNNRLQDICLAFYTGVCLLLHENSTGLSALLLFSKKQPPVNSDE